MLWLLEATGCASNRSPMVHIAGGMLFHDGSGSLLGCSGCGAKRTRMWVTVGCGARRTGMLVSSTCNTFPDEAHMVKMSQDRAPAEARSSKACHCVKSVFGGFIALKVWPTIASD